MLTPSEFRDLVSGRRHGPAASALRGLLRVVETPYTIAVTYRNRRFDSGHNPVHRVAAPVICVGNLTLGGTGKTPLVKWLARYLESLGARVAIVSRGYGAANGAENRRHTEREMHSFPLGRGAWQLGRHDTLSRAVAPELCVPAFRRVCPCRAPVEG
jgi:tetraacyldisaccharide 4'-kinase